MRGEREGKSGTERRTAPEGRELPGRALAALTTSALSIPGLAGSAAADTPIEQANAGYAFSYYVEDDLEPEDFSGSGARERYEVFTHQLEFDFPTSQRMDVGVDFLYEKMSGASPWYVEASGTERVQVMSGATIDDTRYDLSVDLDYYLEDAKDTFAVGFSKEQDYFSVHGTIATERSFFDKNTTFNFSGTGSYDWIDPNNPGLSLARPETGEKWSVELFGGLSQLLTRASAVQFTSSYKYSNGYLSDPYKAIRGIGPGDGILSDRRPSEKHQGNLMARYRHHFPFHDLFPASVHVDYRFYADDWAVTSHTFELAWHQGLAWFTLTPAVRYYSQSKADFYDTLLPAGAAESDPGERSSDYRLSPYGAISWKVKAEVGLEDLLDYQASNRAQSIGLSGGVDLFVALSYERYLSDGAFGIISVDDEDEAPALVDFQVFALTVSGRF